MAAKRRADVTWENDLIRGSGKVRFGTGALPETGVTWVSRTEQPGGKTSPEELLAAAHASCYAMALSATLAGNKTPPTRLDVTAECTFDRVGDKWKVTAMELTVKGFVPNIDSAKFEEMAKIGEASCPISNALRNNVEIKVNASLEQ
ncbi:OsmC family peroxiredoxin [Candidatus Bathyarchaeota archaeon]|nr:OsmC family peroxiredoxin [Candidatus Bathyarchaeota archaeon]